ncbi:1-phosphofructokinase family hexose kinase [Bacteroidota bacterium]
MLLAVCPNPSVDHYIWTDSLEPGKVHRALREKKYPGGKGVHVAMAAAELGEEVTLLGFWGAEVGRWIKNECHNKNINCIGPELTESSRSCYTYKSDGVYDDTELLGCGPEINLDDFRMFTSEFGLAAEKSSVITMSGSWPKGSPPHGYAELMQIAKKSGKPVFLDATGESFRNGLNEGPYAIHLNHNEGKSITGLSGIPEMIDYFRKFAELVAITAGAEGLYLGFNDSIIHGKVKLDHVHSAVGSGDCLTAGLATGLIRKMKTEDVVRMGVACGASNCLRKDLGMLYKSDVERLLDEIEISLL